MVQYRYRAVQYSYCKDLAVPSQVVRVLVLYRFFFVRFRFTQCNKKVLYRR